MVILRVKVGIRNIGFYDGKICDANLETHLLELTKEVVSIFKNMRVGFFRFFTITKGGPFVNGQKMRNRFEQNRVENDCKQLCKARIGLLVHKYGLSDVVLLDLHVLAIFRIPTLKERHSSPKFCARVSRQISMYLGHRSGQKWFLKRFIWGAIFRQN